MFAAGVIDAPPMRRMVVDPFRGRDDAQKIAEESIVLLKNAKDLLPLDGLKVRSIAVIGAHADIGLMSGGGSAQVDPPGGNALDPKRPTKWGEAVYFPSAPLRYIREHAPNADVRFDPGTDPAAAAAAAKTADVAIVFADQYMSEGGDAPTLSLPGNQDAVIRAVAAANPRTVVVLVTGNPVSMPWLDQVGGVMEAWYPGIGGGQAIANLLFGTVNPSAKLPITFAKSEMDLPHSRIFGMTYQTTNGGLPEHWVSEEKKASFPADYSEGARFGYKWFDSENKQPLFPFGFGLSYTHYEYSGLHLDAALKTASFTVTNTGKRSGTEIAEAYVELPGTSGEHFRRLAGWQRVTLNPGERKTITVPIERLALASFNEAKDAWEWLPGEYTVSIGGSSRDLPLKAEVQLK
jgi:beta-glucosidase